GGFGYRRRLDGVADRQDDGEARARAASGIDLQLEPQHPGDAVDDGEAETQPLRLPGAFLKAGELAEDRGELVHRYADAGIEDLYLDKLPAPARADKDAAGAGVFHRVRDKVLDEAAQQISVGMDRDRGRHDVELELLRGGERLEVCSDL